MPTLKKLINQMEHNDPYIIKINEIIQQDEQTKHILRGLKNDIHFEATFKEYKLVARPQISNPYELSLNMYHFTITKNDKDFIKGSITPVQKIQKFKVTFAYDFEKDLVELNDDIVQLFEDAI
jgi:hypothetical protein